MNIQARACVQSVHHQHACITVPWLTRAICLSALSSVRTTRVHGRVYGPCPRPINTGVIFWHPCSLFHAVHGPWSRPVDTVYRA